MADQASTPNKEKEPFDWERFAVMYPNDNGSARLCKYMCEADRIRYEAMYYEDKEVMSVKEFVEKLDHDDETA